MSSPCQSSRSIAAREAPPVFAEEIDVRVVNVEAVVTDRAGNRVPDLKPGDLRLPLSHTCPPCHNLR